MKKWKVCEKCNANVLLKWWQRWCPICNGKLNDEQS